MHGPPDARNPALGAPGSRNPDRPGGPICSQDKAAAGDWQHVNDAARRALLHLLRVHRLRVRLHLSEIDMIGVALAGGLIGLEHAVAIVDDIDPTIIGAELAP